MKDNTPNFTSELFEPEAKDNQKEGKGNADDKEEKKRQFLNNLTEDDIKRRHYESHDEIRKAKRYRGFVIK
jgi:hypothetical protein